ncbi:MAG TPA: alpha/beta hydrolase-fold protein [Erysipelothrix sp.]|nr:alpha/beta hydrolase-fold protein [Erysipelothrix sp.]
MAKLTLEIVSQSLSRRVPITAIIPEGEIPPNGFPCLYLLHGLTGNHSDWSNNTNIQILSNLYQIAFVMPSGDNKFYLDHPDSLDFYSAYIGQELINITRDLLPLSVRRQDTWIGGLSMGGYGALINGLKYNQNFSAIFAFSSALLTNHLPEIVKYDFEHLQNVSYLTSIFGDLDKVKGSDKDVLYYLSKLESEDIPQIYLSCGDQDMFTQLNRDLHQYLKSLAIGHVYHEIPGGHDWETWQSMIESALSYKCK